MEKHKKNSLMMVIQMLTNNLLQEAVNYFKEREVYEKVFKKFLVKYEGLGHFGGTINFSSLTFNEKEQLEGFLQRDFTNKKNITISFKTLEKALENSKFSALTWEEIIKKFFNIQLISKKEKTALENEEKDLFFQEIISKYNENIAISWFKKLVANSQNGNNLILQNYRNNKKELKKTLENVFDSIQFIPKFMKNSSEDYQEILPIFAATATGNPHYFDEGTLGEKILTLFLIDFYKITKEDFLSYSEYKSKIWFEAGIIKDEVSNDVLIYGIKGIDNKNNIHQGIEDFSKRNEPIRLTLFNLQNLSKLFPYDEREEIIYIVENPAIFSLFIKKFPNRTVICGNGQIRRAVLMALDLFDINCKFYYSGDLDPEGLLIAQKLKNRYGTRLFLWKYEVELYKAHLSDIELDESRLKKLTSIEDPDLLSLKEEMLIRKRAVYQEQIITELFL